MPSEKVLQKKQEAVTKLTTNVKDSIAGVLVDYKGISVEDDVQLRADLREAGVEYSVIKNGLLVRAFNEVGFDSLKDVLVGPTALAISRDDAVAPAKVIAKYSEKLKTHFTIKAGFVDGHVISVNEVNTLAKLPSREELIAKAMGSMNAPIAGLANVLNGTIRALAIALSEVAKQKA